MADDVELRQLPKSSKEVSYSKMANAISRMKRTLAQYITLLVSTFYLDRSLNFGLKFANSSPVCLISLYYQPLENIHLKTEGFFRTEGILSRIFETAATARLQVGVMLVHER